MKLISWRLVPVIGSLFLPVSSWVQSATVEEVRAGMHHDRTRLVFDVSEPVNYKLDNLESPDRLVLDFKATTSHINASDIKNVLAHTAAPITDIEVGPSEADQWHLMVTVKAGTSAKIFSLGPLEDRGHRVVLDLFMPESGSFRQSLTAAVPAQRMAEQSAAGSTGSTPVSGSAEVESKKRYSQPTGRVSLSGTWEQEWAPETDDFDSQKFEAIIEPRVDVRLSDGSRLTGVARIRLDTIGDLGPDESRPDNYSSVNGPIYNNENAELSLRELYFDTQWGDSAWRLGKQQIVWGQADGIKVLDVVNPQSYREFILDDFDDSRIPLWSVSVDASLGDATTLQLLWIPDTTYHELAEYESPFFVTSPKLVPVAPAGLPVDILNPDAPDNLLGDSDAGARLSSFIGGWDITANYLYHYQDSPVYYQRLESTAVGVQGIVSPEYERNHLVGGTLSNAFGELTVRSELAYSSDTFHVSRDIDNRGINDSAEFASVLGLDWQVSSDILVSTQWFYSFLLDYESSVVRDESEHILSALVQSEFDNAAWKVHLLSLYSTNDDDVMVQLKLAYWLRGNMEVWMGSDLFYGSRDGAFGQFKDSNRLLFGFEYGF